MEELDALLQPLSVDQLILLLTATERERMRLGGDTDHKRKVFLVARELVRRKVNPLPFLAAALTLDVPE
jgi:hypothetical protein